MNRREFMNQLEILLQSIPEQERVEAIQYYNDYFDDAGEENEQDVMAALGTPAKVAENIKRDLNQNRYGYGFEQEKVENGKEIVKYQPEVEKVQPTKESSEKKGLSTGMIVLIVLLCVFSPLVIGLLSGLFGIISGIVITWLVLVVVFGVLALVFLVTGVAVAVVGAIGIITSPLAGIGIIGTGLLVAAAGILFLMLTVFMAGYVTPAVVKGIVKLCRRLTKKNKAV